VGDSREEAEDFRAGERQAGGEKEKLKVKRSEGLSKGALWAFGGKGYRQIQKEKLKRKNEKGYFMEMRKEIVRSGISFDTALAVAISWSINHSVLWAIVHGFFSWLYVGYYVIFR